MIPLFSCISCLWMFLWPETALWSWTILFKIYFSLCRTFWWPWYRRLEFPWWHGFPQQSSQRFCWSWVAQNFTNLQVETGIVLLFLNGNVLIVGKDGKCIGSVTLFLRMKHIRWMIMVKTGWSKLQGQTNISGNPNCSLIKNLLLNKP